MKTLRAAKLFVMFYILLSVGDGEFHDANL